MEYLNQGSNCGGQIYLVVVYIWQGQAYIPTQARYESGIYIGIEPVLVVGLNASELILAIQIIKGTGHKLLPEPKTREEFLASEVGKKDPVLEATGARNWAQLAKKGASYTIGWTEHEIRIDVSRLDKKGRWEFDPEKAKKIPPTTQLSEVVIIILDDIKSRPEVH